MNGPPGPSPSGPPRCRVATRCRSGPSASAGTTGVNEVAGIGLPVSPRVRPLIGYVSAGSTSQPGGIYLLPPGAAKWQAATLADSSAAQYGFSYVGMTWPLQGVALSGNPSTHEIWMTTDGGQSWVDISSSLPAGVGFVTNPLVLDAKSFLLGTNRGTNSGIFRSTDGGKIWKVEYDFTYSRRKSASN